MWKYVIFKKLTLNSRCKHRGILSLLFPQFYWTSRLLKPTNIFFSLSEFTSLLLVRYYWSKLIIGVFSFWHRMHFSSFSLRFWLWQWTEVLSGIISPSLKNKKDKKNVWRITLKKFQIFFLKKKVFPMFWRMELSSWS